MARLYAGDTIGPSAEYQDVLRKEHDGSKWGSTGGRYSGADVVQLLTERPYIQTVLDFGAGKGNLESFVRERVQRELVWTNYDPGIPAYDEIPTGQFDLVTNTDVMEHIEPERLGDTLKLVASLVGKVLYSDIACDPTGKNFWEGPYKGQDLHLIQQPPSEWRKAYKEHLGLYELVYEHREKRSKKGTKTRCMMIHERV
jgi:hypothetical protein